MNFKDFFPFYRVFTLRKNYLLFSVLIGVGAGIAAILFTYAIELCTRLALEGIVGYLQPRPAGEGGISESYHFIFQRPFLLPLVVALGGLLSGILTYLFSPHSAGVGREGPIALIGARIGSAVEGIGRLMIIDQKGNFVGIISRTDFGLALRKYWKF